MIKHVLKDGTEVPSIRGKVVKEHEAKAVYALIEKINRRANNGNL